MRVQVIPRTQYTFTQANAAGLATAIIVLATRIDTSRCVSGSMYVRLHAKDWSSVSSFTVSAYNVSYTCDEPDAIYIDKATPVARASIAAGDVAPKLYVASLAAPIADQLQVVLEWTHGADAVTKVFAISVELELRDS